MAWIQWDPSRVAFTIPYFDRPVAWYGIMFVVGFFIAYFIGRRFLRDRLKAYQYSPAQASALSNMLCDRLLWYIVIGTIVGSRLGHVFFYDWPMYRDHPAEIFKVWEGGLASHGGAIGVLLAVALFYWRAKKQVPEISLLEWMDLLTVPVAFVITCIRIGNFINQEIVGLATNVPWAVRFMNPMEGLGGIPRHPVQLYEALCYFGLFLFLWSIRNLPYIKTHPGILTGLFFVISCSARFIMESFKEHQNSVLDQSYLHAGQLLSIPFIIFGFFLIYLSTKRSKTLDLL